jgi:hypothetical protein
MADHRGIIGKHYAVRIYPVCGHMSAMRVSRQCGARKRLLYPCDKVRRIRRAALFVGVIGKT